MLPSGEAAGDLHLGLSARYDLVENEISVGQVTFTICGVRDTNRLVDGIDPEMFATDERLPYWSELWSSSVELARYCLESGAVHGKNILELGCGLGLAGIAAAKAGAHVTMTDYEADALRFARYNATRNLPHDVVASNVTFKEMDWRSPRSTGSYDIILGSDVVYERRNFVPLLEVLQNSLRHNGFVMFTDPDRAIGKDFVALAYAHGFHVTSSWHDVVLHKRRSRIVRYRLEKPHRSVLCENAP